MAKPVHGTPVVDHLFVRQLRMLLEVASDYDVAKNLDGPTCVTSMKIIDSLRLRLEEIQVWRAEQSSRKRRAR